jgi:uncharacterized protein
MRQYAILWPMVSYFSWVLRHRLAILLLTVVISLLSLWSLSRAVISTSMAELFFGETPAFAEYLEHIKVYGSDEVFVIAYEESDPLSIVSLDKLQRVQEQIEASPEVQRTRSLLNLDRMESADGLLMVESYADAARASPQLRHELVAEIQADPLLSRTMISASGSMAAMAIELTVDPKRSGEVAPALVDLAVQAFRDQGYPDAALHKAGFPVVIGELLTQTRLSMSTLFPLVTLVMVLIVTVLFRSPKPVALSLGVSMLSVLWTLGLSVAFKPQLNIFHGGVPAVVTVVAVSDVIHLWSAYLHELRDGKTRDEAILLSAVDVGRACLYTSMTTFVGFVSISLIPTPVFRDFGWALGCGVGMALLLAMTFVPIFASLGAPPSDKALRMDNPVAGLVDRIVHLCSQASYRRPWAIIIAFAILMGGSGYLMSQIRIETNGIGRLDSDNPVRVDADLFQEEFTGTITMDLYLDSETPDRMLDLDALTAIAALEQRIEALPQVDKALSHVDIVRRIHQTIGGSGELPSSREAIAQELLLFEMGGGSKLSSVLDFERKGAHMALQTRQRRMRGLSDIGVQIEEMAAEILPPDIIAHSSGMIVLSGGWLEAIIDGQKNGVLASVFSIGLLMMIGLRNIKVGLLSMIPNLLPLIVVAATTGLVWTDMDSDTLVILMMAIGIGVDDTIHFLTRLKTESARSSNRRMALERTFSFAGRAIVMTTIILALGFLPMALSPYYSIGIMGSLLPLALIVAMAADLLLLPAMAEVGWLNFPLEQTAD